MGPYKPKWQTEINPNKLNQLIHPFSHQLPLFWGNSFRSTPTVAKCNAHNTTDMFTQCCSPYQTNSVNISFLNSKLFICQAKLKLLRGMGRKLGACHAIDSSSSFHNHHHRQCQSSSLPATLKRWKCPGKWWTNWEIELLAIKCNEFHPGTNN